MSQKVRRRVLIAIGSVIALAAAVVGGTALYVNVISGDAPAPLALSTAGAAGDIELDGSWAVSAGSQAGYRVDEVLNGQDNTVVGRTDDVDGQITVADGVVTDAEVVVQMGTVTTDSDARDSQFRGPILHTDEFPTATFTLTAPVDLSGLEDGPVSRTIQGELTVRDATRPVEAEVDVQVNGTAVEAAGTIELTFADFDVEPPNLGFVRVEDSGQVEFFLVLER